MVVLVFFVLGVVLRCLGHRFEVLDGVLRRQCVLKVLSIICGRFVTSLVYLILSQCTVLEKKKLLPLLLAVNNRHWD